MVYRCSSPQLCLGSCWPGCCCFRLIARLTHNPQVTATVVAVGFPERFIWMLAVCEAAGAAGILLGLKWWPIGVAASIGVVAYFVLAVAAHLRAKRSIYLAR